MPGWRKVALVVTVGAVHVGFLAGFNFETSGWGSGYPSKSALASVTLMYSVTAPADVVPSTSIADISNQPAAAAKTPSQNPVNTVLTDSSSKTSSSPTLEGSVWSSRIKFLNADEVDKTAYVTDSFEMALEQRLPLDVEPIVLEFWIAEDGSTLYVSCLEGACSDAVMSSLARLSELKFSPAVKNDQAVASRKVIQIEPKPKFGL